MWFKDNELEIQFSLFEGGDEHDKNFPRYIEILDEMNSSSGFD